MPERDYKDLFTRVSADFQNFKRRVEKERSLWTDEAQAFVLKNLVGIMDDLDRAVQKENVPGLELIQKSVEKKFKDLGVEKVDCSGKFDPEFHDALVQVESPSHKTGEIVEVLSNGYAYKSIVLLHAKVSVAK